MKKTNIAALLTVVLAAGALTVNAQNVAAAEDSVTIGTLDLVNGDLIAQYEDWYSTELGVDVKLLKFDSGKDINSALASGSIDIGQEGSSPAAIAISNKLDVDVIWIGDIIGKAETLVAKEDSGIETVEDLVGKTVATPFASTAHFSLLNALKLAGVDENDVTILDMETDKINAAWQTDDIDAAYVWYPVLGELLKNGGVPITDSEELASQGIITADTNVVRKAYAEEHPDVVTKFVELQLKANDIINNDSETAAKEIAAQLEIPEEDAADQITQFTYLDADGQIDILDKEFAAVLKQTADFLVEQGSILEAPDIDVFEDSVTSEYVKKAAAE